VSPGWIPDIRRQRRTRLRRTVGRPSVATRDTLRVRLDASCRNDSMETSWQHRGAARHSIACASAACRLDVGSRRQKTGRVETALVRTQEARRHEHNRAALARNRSVDLERIRSPRSEWYLPQSADLASVPFFNRSMNRRAAWGRRRIPATNGRGAHKFARHIFDLEPDESDRPVFLRMSDLSVPAWEP
jgi:hypothetical protein